MKQQISSMNGGAKLHDRVMNILQTSVGGVHRSNGFSSSTPINEKNFVDDLRSTANFEFKIYGASSAATLQQLKKLLLDQAKELKKCKSQLSEKTEEIGKLKEENETLKGRLQRAERKIQWQNAVATQPPAAHETVETSPPPPVAIEKVKKTPGRKRRISSTLSASDVEKKSEIKNAPPPHKRVENPSNAADAANKAPKNVGRTSSHIYTPSWRIQPFSSLTALEGTENITDDAFAKRHQKCEIEEKRIIRRDRARERELEMRRRLLENQKNTMANKPDSSEFTIEAVEIVKKLPASMRKPVAAKAPCLTMPAPVSSVPPKKRRKRCI